MKNKNLKQKVKEVKEIRINISLMVATLLSPIVITRIPSIMGLYIGKVAIIMFLSIFPIGLLLYPFIVMVITKPLMYFYKLEMVNGRVRNKRIV